jgi:hypothetical protein
MPLKIAILVAILIAVLSACSPAAPQETGTLEGHVTIGPLSPVVQAGASEPTPAPEVYAARQIVILSEDGEKELARVQISADGIYRIELAPGAYQVDIARTGIDFSKDLPARVEIRSDETTRLDVDIDTGIR